VRQVGIWKLVSTCTLDKGISGIAAASGQVGYSVVLPAETSALEPRSGSGLELFEEVEYISEFRTRYQQTDKSVSQ
jgi:hypothetical protein